MSTDTQSAPETAAEPQTPAPVQRRLPRSAPLGLYLIGIALGAASSAATGFGVTSAVI
jgi:phosphate transport system permease protein